MATDKFLEDVEKRIAQAELNSANTNANNQMIQQEAIMGQQEKSMAEEQLNMDDELIRIDYLIRGYTLEFDDKTGESKWVKPLDNNLIILSEKGVHLIRNTIAWYMNKNTLLSNYEDEVIREKMEDFASDLNDLFLMEYEGLFQYPTFDDCKRVLKERLKRKQDMRKFALEILGKEITEALDKEIEQEVLAEIEPTIEKETKKIAEQIMKNKMKRYPLLVRVIQDAIHSTYLRAWKGQERTTLRQRINISETRGGFSIPREENKTILSLLRRR